MRPWLGSSHCPRLGVPGHPRLYAGPGWEATPLRLPGGVKTYRAGLGPAGSLGMPDPFAEVSLLTPPTLNWRCPALGSVQGPIHTAVRDANVPSSPARAHIAPHGALVASRDLTFPCWHPQPPTPTPIGVPAPALPSAQLPALQPGVPGVSPAQTCCHPPEGQGDAEMLVGTSLPPAMLSPSPRPRGMQPRLSEHQARAAEAGSTVCLWRHPWVVPPTRSGGSLCCLSSWCKPLAGGRDP